VNIPDSARVKFQPGQSGNPGGLTKEVAARIREAKRLAAEAAPDAVNRLIALMNCGKPEVEKAAADSILDRAGVKVIKGVEVGDSDGNPLPAGIVVQLVKPENAG
jgi:hypothetical protein